LSVPTIASISILVTFPLPPKLLASIGAKAIDLSDPDERLPELVAENEI